MRTFPKLMGSSCIKLEKVHDFQLFNETVVVAKSLKPELLVQMHQFGFLVMKMFNSQPLVLLRRCRDLL